MASTSKQADSCCSKPEMWDVFLSFGGKDARKGFVGHLYSALDQAGVRIFKDDPELERGEEIAPQLIEAIRDSKMSIVVFSKNYAASSWCLNELAEIFECKKSKGQIVIPVFYKVDPSSVRNHKRSYAEAFEKHNARNLKEVERWRAALKGIADVSGYDLKNDANGDEADLIHKIVDAALSQLSPKDINLPHQLIGIDRHVEALCRKLSIGSDAVLSLGIYGMPGVGKTTTAKALYNKIHKQFEGSCFLENVRDDYQKPRGELDLLGRLAFELGKVKDFKITSVDGGVNFVKYRLRKKKVLIVLDDVDQISQLETLAGNSNWFGPGSRIIVTTRNVRILDEYQIDMKHEVEELSYTEALELFTIHAFKHTTPSENLIGLSKDMVRYTGGLPLALEVVGSSLFRRSIDLWECTFDILKEIPPKNIQEKFIISYNALDDDKIQNIFLDIAFFFIGMDKDDAIRILDACGFHSKIGISILMERCLLTVNNWGNKLQMHNLIRDMGREIVRLESVKNPGKRSRLWLQEDARTVLNQMMVHDSIEGLKLVIPGQGEVDISTSAFRNVPKLRLLEIDNVNLIGSFENIFEELKWLSWKGCSLVRLPSSFQPPKLVSLDIKGSKVDELWEGSKKLQSLRILDASGSKFLRTTPDFKGLESLEKLILKGCSSLTEIHPSIGLLHKLVHLSFGNCPYCSPNIFEFSFASIEELPDSIGSLGALKTLHLAGCRKLRNLPSSICNLISIEHLCLYSCLKLKRLPEKLGNMHGLRYLCLRNMEMDRCYKLTKSPSSMSNLTSLETLHLGNCEPLVELPDLSNLTQLRTLDCTNSINLKSKAVWSCMQDYHGTEGCDIFLSDTEIPECFSYQTTDSDSISFQIPHHIQTSHPRLAFWLVSDKYFPRSPLNHAVEAKSWVRFMGNSVSVRSGDTFQLSTVDALSFSYGRKIKKCGVHIY